MMRRFFIEGTPQPKGSMRAFVFGNRAAITHDNKKTEPWANYVVKLARRLAPDVPADFPVSVTLTFNMPRPKNHYNKQGQLKNGMPGMCLVKPDIDKLARTMLDALTRAGFWTDDSRVVGLTCYKRYSELPGVNVLILRYDSQQLIDHGNYAGGA